MKRYLWIGLVGLLLTACGPTAEQKRIAALNAMPVLWETELLVADPNMPELKTLIPLEDRFDPNLVQMYMNETRKTPDAIPESVFAFATKEFRNKPREVTIRIGDRVSVLARGKANTRIPMYLVRTKHGTYAWLYAYHIQDKGGQRIAKLE